MRIIKQVTVQGWRRSFPKAAAGLAHWLEVIRAARWKNFVELRKAFASADLVAVKSGRKVIVFNVCKNDFRLIAAVHFDAGKVFALRFFTHAEYDKDHWKNEL